MRARRTRFNRFDFSGLSLNVHSHREHESLVPVSAAPAQFPASEEHSLHCALRQRKAVEMECLKINCSWLLSARTTAYLSKQRTLPVTRTPFSRYTVTCRPACRAALKNDSWIQVTDMKFAPDFSGPIRGGNLPGKINALSSICPIYNRHVFDR